MSADAKVWKDETGWHGICDDCPEQLNGTDYDLAYIIKQIESRMGIPLDWEIFAFSNGLGLRGYRAKSK